MGRKHKLLSIIIVTSSLLLVLLTACDQNNSVAIMSTPPTSNPSDNPTLTDAIPATTMVLPTLLTPTLVSFTSLPPPATTALARTITATATSLVQPNATSRAIAPTFTPIVAPTPTPSQRAKSAPQVPAATPVPAATSAPNPVTSAIGEPDNEEQAFLEQLNTFRKANQRPPLAFDPLLFTSARWMAQDMATKNYINHTDSTGRDANTRIHAFGFKGRWVGENIAGGFEHAPENLTIWQSDDIHRNNLLGPAYTKAGVGRYYNKTGFNRWVWVLDMG